MPTSNRSSIRWFYKTTIRRSTCNQSAFRLGNTHFLCSAIFFLLILFGIFFFQGTLEIEPETETKTPKLPDFFIEYTREGTQDSCAACQQKINKNEVRIMNVVYDTAMSTAFDGKAMW